MSAQFIPDQGDESIVERNDSPGCRLRGARQARGLSVEQAAAQLHLAPDIILALERDDYAALQGHVFVTGYTRNYARLVMLDPEPLLEKYRATVPEAPPLAAQPHRHTPPPRQPGNSRLPVKLFGLAVFVGICALVLFWWYDQYGTAPEVPESSQADIAIAPATDLSALDEEGEGDAVPFMTTAQVPVEPDPQASALSPPEIAISAPKPESEAMPAEMDEQPAASTPEPVIEPETETEKTAELLVPGADSQPGTRTDRTPTEKAAAEADTPPATKPAEGEIVIAFSGPCWVDIRDSERKFKLFGEMGKGDRHALEGTPPYSVILGNTSAVSITVGGAPFDLSGISRGNVARFTLDPTELP